MKPLTAGEKATRKAIDSKAFRKFGAVLAGGR